MAWRRARSTPPDQHPPTPEGAAAVRFDDVDAHRGRTLALRDVSFKIPHGTITAVVGPNGAGKSSLFGLISRRLEPTTGTVRVQGPVAEVLQRTHLDPDLPLTVDDVVRIGRYPSRGLLGPMRRDDRQRIDEALDAVDLTALRTRPINELSGGQQQRALVAQGIAQDAPILLLDEPTAGLDVASQRLVVEAIRSQAERGVTVLVATHDLREAADADNVLVLACECVCCAPPVDAFADPAVTALFGTAPAAEAVGASMVDQPIPSRTNQPA